jgi:ComF family protein
MLLRLPKISAVAFVDEDCVLCGANCASVMVCPACAASLPVLAPGIHRVVAPFEYRFPIDRLVQRFKFAGDLALGRWLALQLARRARAESPPQVLVPVPLTRGRLRSRGFNQSVEIARVVSRELRIPAAMQILERTRDAPPQAGLTRRARRANLRGAFRCQGRAFDGRHVALIDDVVTTGATAEAAVRALRRAGAVRVDLWALARTPDSRGA